MQPPVGRAHWDDALAREHIGKYVIVGLTYEGSDGQPLRREQLHGRIAFVDPMQGFCVVLEGVKLGMVYWMPPDLQQFRAARAGEYRLRSTGEVVVQPDLLANWLITTPAAGSPTIELQKVQMGTCPTPDP